MSNLPSNTRLVLQIILLPEPFNAYLANKQLPNRSGYIYGSIAFPVYDLNRRLRQGTQRMLAWPLQKYDPRFICVGDCYKYKHQSDIEKNFDNNLDVFIQMPKFHQDVIWNIGFDMS